MRTATGARMHPMPRMGFCLGCVLALLPVVAQAGGLEDAFAAMDKTAQQFRSVSADIHRDIYTALIDEHEKDTGTLKARREKSHTMMLLEFQGPQPKSIELGNGKAIVYNPKSKIGDSYPIGPGLVDQFLLLGFGSPSAEVRQQYEVTYLGTDKVDSAMAWRLQLIPKSPEELKYLRKAELWISQTTGLPVREKLYTSSSGDYYLVDYSNVKLNPSLSDKDVKLNLPKGVITEHPRL